MAVYYKFKSAKDFDTIPIDGHFISVANLKERIFESKHLGRGTDFDLMVANAQTNEEYPDEATLIPKNTSVLVRRVPGRPRMPIVSEREEPKVEDNKAEDVQSTKGSSHMADSSSKKFAEETEWDEFGNDLYAIPEVVPGQFSHPVQDAPPPNKADEDSKIKALIDMPAFGALDWQQQPQEGFGSGRGFGRGMGGRMIGGRGFGRGGMERKTPPPGYTCHRCKVPGHFIQHCPTNGDPNYDIKRFKPPTGIPKSMLMATPDGSYGLPSGAVAILKPNEAAFEKEIEGLPSTRPVTDLPPELHCPLCKEVMKDAVLTSKCCFNSFCDKCIRDHIISKSMCICGATNILADDLLPNKALRDTINRILESNNSSAENGGSTFQVQDMESARCAQPKVPSPTLSATSKGGQMAPPCKDETLDIKEAINEGRLVSNPPELLEKVRIAKTAERSEATLESMSVKEPMSQGSAPQAEEEVQQKLPPVEPGKKKKKMKTRLPVNAADLQWRTSQDLTSENHMIPFGPSAYNSYWGGMPLGMDGYMAPYTNAMPYMGYAPGPFDVPFGGYLPQDPFGGQGYLPVVPPQRDLSEFGIGSNPKPPVMSREEFEARKADVRKKRENELRRERECSKDREFGGEGSGTGDVSSTKSKHRPFSLPTSGDHHHHHHRRRAEYASSPERPSREFDHVRLGKRRPDHHDDLAVETAKAAADKKLKASVFSRISFPEGVGSKKRKSSSETNNSSNGYKDYDPPVSSTQHRPLSNGYRDERKPPIKGTAVTASSGGAQKGVTVHYDSSDDERHFKRRPSRYEPPPPPPVEWDEDRWPLRSSREHEQERSRQRT